MSNLTAAIVIIGNEILSGRTLDTNTQFIARKLFSIGVFLREVRIILDKKQSIIDTVLEVSSKYDYVFTTGGIGPTHDDITAEAISATFNVPLILNEDAYKDISDYYCSNNLELNDARMKMAYVPQGAELIKNTISGAPGFNIKNVYVLPGVPSIMQIMLEDTLSKLQHGDSFETKSYRILLAEGLISKDFASLQNEYPVVDMGSYPFEDHGNYGTLLVLTSSNYAEFSAACARLEALLDSMNIKIIP